MTVWQFAQIDRALNRPAPNQISLIGPRALRNDFFEIIIEVPSLGWKLLCRAKEAKGYAGFLWVNERGGTDATVLLRTLKRESFSVSITHYYRGYKLEYRSPIYFLVSYYLHRHWLYVIKNKLSQSVYNRKTLVRSERMELLEYLVEQTIAEPGYRTDPLDLGMHMNSERWLYHPRRTEHQARYRMVLESLVETGDLERRDHAFCVTAKALSTLSEYERDQQKHQDNINNARAARRVTVVLAVIAFAGICAQLFMWWVDRA